MKKNICLITSNLNVFGGAQRVCINLANEFAERGYKIKVVSLEFCIKPVYKLGNIEFISVKKNIRARDILKPSVFIKIRKIFKDFSTDIIMVVGVGATFGVIPALGTKARIIICEHTAYKNKFEQNVRKNINRYIGVKIANKIVTLTKDNMGECKRRFKVNDSKVTYIYNFAPDSNEKEKQEPYNFNSRKIITVGRIEPVKGYDMLVDVAELVFKNNTSWSWDIYGDVEDREYFQMISEKIKQRNLDTKIHFRGHSDNLQTIFPQYAMYVMTSYNEGLPMVLLEAKSAGLPLISFDIATGPNEIIRNGFNGELVAAYDVNKMASVIMEMMENGERRVVYSNNAKVIDDKFLKNNVVSKWEDLFYTL